MRRHEKRQLTTSVSRPACTPMRPKIKTLTECHVLDLILLVLRWMLCVMGPKGKPYITFYFERDTMKLLEVAEGSIDS